MIALKGLNLALAFFLELVMLAAFGYWGFNTGESTLVHLVLGIGVPLVAIVIWGIYNAPNSKRRLATVPRFILELIMFTLAAVGLVAMGQISWAVVFMAAVLINQALLLVWKQ